MKSFSMNSSLANEYSNWDQVDIFRALLDNFCLQIEKEGIKSVLPYTSKSLAAFENLPRANQSSITTNFLKYYELCANCVESGISLRDSRLLLWKILPELGLRPLSDLFDRLDDSQVIEVYLPNFTQVFRNLKFLELCSYPVADLYVMPWPELFARPDEITNTIIASISKCLEKGGTTNCVVPDHFLYERHSPSKQKVKIEQGIFSPLFDQHGKPAAFVGTLKATVIEKYADIFDESQHKRSTHLEEKNS